MLILQSPADGRRAPVAREFKQRTSVVTQTPPMYNMSDVGDSIQGRSSTDNSSSVAESGSREDLAYGTYRVLFVLHAFSVLAF
jgi:hypothetical protein